MRARSERVNADTRADPAEPACSRASFAIGETAFPQRSCSDRLEKRLFGLVKQSGARRRFEQEECYAERAKSLRKSSLARCRPSSVRTTDFALLAGFSIRPLLCRRSRASQSKPFQARFPSCSVSHK